MRLPRRRKPATDRLVWQPGDGRVISPTSLPPDQRVRYEAIAATITARRDAVH